MMSVQLSLVATLNSVSAAVQKRSKLACSFNALHTTVGRFMTNRTECSMWADLLEPGQQAT